MKKRLLAVSAALTLMMAMALSVLPVSASEPTEQVKSLVVFGDSISAGYGLNGTLYTRSSYANQVAAALGLSQGNGYVNHAVDGYTSADILKKAIDNEKDVAGADLIVLTNGGNDVLSKMLMIAMQALGITSFDLTSVGVALSSTTADALNAKLYSDTNNAVIAAALEGYRENLSELVTYFQTTAPEARVVFLTQYNPLSGVPGATLLDAYSEDIIGQLNAVMTEIVTAGGYELVDTHSVMVGNGLIMSNIAQADIHPNALGHTMMAQKVKEHLGLTEQGTTTTTTTQTTTTEITTTTTTTTTATETTTTSEQSTQTTTAESEITTSTAKTEPEETAPTGADPNEGDNENDRDDGGKRYSMVPLVVSAVLLTAGIACVIVAAALRKKSDTK